MPTVSTPPEFAQTLRDVLALPADDQVRLHAVLERVTGAIHSPSALQMVAAPLPAGDPAPQEDVTQWLVQVRELPVWTQLQLLDEALASAVAPEEMALLESARSQILRAHPPLAVRRAVVALATRQPIATSVGSVGLVVGVFGIGRLLARLMF